MSSGFLSRFRICELYGRNQRVRSENWILSMTHMECSLRASTSQEGKTRFRTTIAIHDQNWEETLSSQTIRKASSRNQVGIITPNSKFGALRLRNFSLRFLSQSQWADSFKTFLLRLDSLGRRGTQIHWTIPMRLDATTLWMKSFRLTNESESFWFIKMA